MGLREGGSGAYKTPEVVTTKFAASVWGKGVDFHAYTVAELGEMLPDYITGEHLYSYQQYRNWSDRKKPKHALSYWFMGKTELYNVDASTEADARAKMLIYLLENGLLTA